ncbi:MAG: type II toxin-antitoxin system RelE/ParE family toxin [Candidatus Pacebacteria bacterium]|nr:type II toxin-antitoxin system RelE/ParE family toxin [Candidatus Paceibacterota bacterium]
MLKIEYYYNNKDLSTQVREEIRNIDNDNIITRLYAIIVHVATNQGKTNSVFTKNIKGYHFSEIRIKFSSQLYRLLYFIWKDEKMTLLHLFVKKEGEKTPVKELGIAENRYSGFINNYKKYEQEKKQ